jgi:RNA polymerase sigma factor (TIGR02999 family)
MAKPIDSRPSHNPAESDASGISELLRAWGAGDLEARDRLFALVYRDLKERAAAYLRRERRDHTLQTTALVNEAYVRLVNQDRIEWRNRAQFFGVAAQMMRRILVDHARARQAAKRPSPALRVAVAEDVATVDSLDCEILVLDAALEELARLDRRQGDIVEMRYFGGLTEDEIGAVLSISRSTVAREWQTARAWLFRRITKGALSS